MKSCPTCQKIYEDPTLYYCLDDGSPLTVRSHSEREIPTEMIGSNDLPTIPIVAERTRSVGRMPTTGHVPNTSRPSPVVYVLLGVLSTGLVGAAGYIYFSQGRTGPAEETTSRLSANAKNTPADSLPPAKQTPVDQITVRPNEPVPRPVVSVPQLTPSGNWSGTWIGKSSEFTAAMNLQEKNGIVTGQIVWTLQRSTNPEKGWKAGLAATEYIQGTFDRTTRMIKIRGIRKDDPNGLVILDTYNLSLSETGDAMAGRSKNGVFTMKRS